MKTFNYTLNNKPLEMLIDFSLFKEEKNILIQIFCGNKKDNLKKLIETISEKLPQAICIGASTDGEINGEKISTLKTVISISIFEKTTLKAKCVNFKNSFQNGAELAKELCSDKTKLLITFTDGNKTNGEEFLNGISFVNNSVIVCGGMAGDNAHFTQTFISCQNKILTKGAVTVALNSKNLKVCNAFNFNWSAIGIDHKIEEVVGN